jgi:Domain of unknown function (DUF4388)
MAGTRPRVEIVKLTLPPQLEGLPEISGAMRADAQGRVDGAPGPEDAARGAAASATVREIIAAGAAAGLSRLELVLVRGPSASTATAVRSDGILLVAVDPAKGTAQVEKALQSWAAAEAPVAAASVPSASTPPPVRAPGTVPPPGASSASTPPPLPYAAASARPSAASARPRPAGDAWAGLRYSLARGLLTDAAVRRRELAGGVSQGAGAGAGRASEIDASMQILVQGIGSVLAGDGVGGARVLEPLCAEGQRNLSFRWLALYWSGRAALKSGSSATARRHIMPALLIAKGLDADAVAVTQWFAGELLAHDAEHPKALSCFAAARATFEKAKDGWGVARCWLAEASVLVSTEREAEGIAAARRASEADPGWEDPPVFLVRRALMRNDLAEAEGLLGQLSGTSAERMRSFVDAIRRALVSPADAREFLVESEATPTVRSIKAIQRIAQAAPRFPQAREALAWMLLRVGKYAEANTLFRGLLSTQLTRGDRASVMLGLGCIAHAQAGKEPAAVVAGAAPAAGESQAQRPGPLSSAALPARSSQLGGGAVFSGQLSVFALPDVIEFLRSARRTGTLVCSSEAGMAELCFRVGRITGAASPGAPGLGEILLRARKISPVALSAVATDRPLGEPDHVFGGRLVRDGIVDATSYAEALRRKVETALHELLQWKGGEFAFNREGEGEAPSPDAPEFDAQDVLLTVVKKMDEDARDRADRGARA